MCHPLVMKSPTLNTAFPLLVLLSLSLFGCKSKGYSFPGKLCPHHFYHNKHKKRWGIMKIEEEDRGAEDNMLSNRLWADFPVPKLFM